MKLITRSKSLGGFWEFWRKFKVEKTKIEKALEVLRAGGVIVYPTDTVYGLGADIFSHETVDKIYSIKGREETKALSIAVKLEDISLYGEVNETAQELIDKYLPGALTLLLPKSLRVPEWLSKNEFIGIRVPSNEFCKEITEKFGAITSTSANISGEKEAFRVSDISKEVLDKVDLVIDEGETKYKGVSTIVQVAGEEVKVLRKGVLEIKEKFRNDLLL